MITCLCLPSNLFIGMLTNLRFVHAVRSMLRFTFFPGVPFYPRWNALMNACYASRYEQ